MQKKKNIQLLISLIVLLISCTLFFFFSSSDRTSIDQSIFQISNLEKIDRVELQSSHEKIELKFTDNQWRVNGLEADPQMITVLFATLKQTQAKRKVATHQQDSLQNEIKKSGVKISCFENNQLAKEFWSLGDAKKNETYFFSNDGIPYVVAIPGYRVFIASIFALPTNEWRDKRIFNFNWQNIKSLEVNFLADEKQSFKASFKEGVFGIEGIKTDTTKLDVFMDVLFQLRAEKLLTNEQAKKYDSLLQQPMMERIVITDIGNQKYELSLFPFKKSTLKWIGKRNDDLVEVNPSVLREIFRGKDYFKVK